MAPQRTSNILPASLDTACLGTVVAVGVLSATLGMAVAGDLKAAGGKTWAAPAGLDAVVCLTLSNQGGEADRLLSVTSAVSERARVRGRGPTPTGHGWVVDGVEVPGGGKTELDHSGTHILLEGLVHGLEPGEEFHVTLVFEKAGPVEAQIEVDPNCEEPVLEAID